LIFIHFIIQLKWHFLLNHLHQEKADWFWNKISNISQNNCKVRVNPHSHFIHKDFCRVNWFLWLANLLILIILSVLALALLVILLLLRLFLLFLQDKHNEDRYYWYYTSSFIDITNIICKEITSFCFDYVLNNFSCFFLFSLEDLRGYFLNFLG